MLWDKIEKRTNLKELDKYKWTNLLNSGYEVTDSNLKESTYFSCIRIISESIAKCPIQVKKETEKGEQIAKQHELYNMLRLRPNPYMTAINCIKAFTMIAKHEGISGLYINRIGNKVDGLYPVKITNIIVDDKGLIKSNKNNKILYDFEGVNGETGSCFDKNIIILRDFSIDGINTNSTRKIAKQSLDTSVKAQKYLNTLFTNGLTNKIVVQLASDIKEEKEIKKIQEKFSRIYSSNGKVFTVPAGYNISALNLSLADAQYEQLRRLSKEEIASMLGVPLTKLGFVKENAKSEEQDNLKFLQDTLLVIFENIEQEMDYKLLTKEERELGYKIRFNINVLLRTDAQSQANIINSYVKNGVYSLNVAKEILGIEKLDKDVTTFPSGQVTLESLQNNDENNSKKGGVNNEE